MPDKSGLMIHEAEPRLSGCESFPSPPPARRTLHPDFACSTASSGVTEDGPDNLLTLEDFDDNDLLQALWQRYERKNIYTWVGNLLVAVNPYFNIGVFKDEVAASYASASPPNEPHLYSVVMGALQDAGNKQAILISGESGAGKTEATRAVLQFLALNCTATLNIRERILRSTPVLEAFGNAQTRQNKNSSRFGKFIEVYFSGEKEVIGATLHPYMLESSRVAGVLPEGERTYHVFYLLRAGLAASAPSRTKRPPCEILDQSTDWKNLIEDSMEFMQNSPRLASDTPDDEYVHRFQELVEGLFRTGLDVDKVVGCFRIVIASIALVDNSTELASRLLQIEEADVRKFLTTADMSIGGEGANGEHVLRDRTERESTTICSTLAQELYSSLFTWLTRQVAKGILPPFPTPSGGRVLGLLDLYGFEVFSTNGFEQFLINYCNERMQQFSNRQVFLCEAEEYAAEGLDTNGNWHRVAAACKLPALALLEGEAGPSGTVGLFGVLNDRSRCGFETQGGEVSGNSALIAAITQSCGKHIAFRHAGTKDNRLFGVRHFAGDVYYEAAQFVRKNSSANRPEVIGFLRSKGCDFVREVFDALEQDSSSEDPKGNVVEAGPQLCGKPRKKKPGRTQISIFQQELNELCASLEARLCRHVRCLRPNDTQAALHFDDSSMLRQCRYSGLLEAARIRRSGYAHRQTIPKFVFQYKTVLPTRDARRNVRDIYNSRRWQAPLGSPEIVEVCRAICEFGVNSGLPQGHTAIGHTKVFFGDPAKAWLNKVKRCRAYGTVYALLKCHVDRVRFKRTRKSTIRLQAAVRGRFARKFASLLRQQRAEAIKAAVKAACVIQRHFRICLQRRFEAVADAAAHRLQRWFRRCLKFRQVRAMAEDSDNDNLQGLSISSSLQGCLEYESSFIMRNEIADEQENAPTQPVVRASRTSARGVKQAPGIGRNTVTAFRGPTTRPHRPAQAQESNARPESGSVLLGRHRTMVNESKSQRHVAKKCSDAGGKAKSSPKHRPGLQATPTQRFRSPNPTGSVTFAHPARSLPSAPIPRGPRHSATANFAFPARVSVSASLGTSADSRPPSTAIPLQKRRQLRPTISAPLNVPVPSRAAPSARPVLSATLPVTKSSTGHFHDQSLIAKAKSRVSLSTFEQRSGSLSPVVRRIRSPSDHRHQCKASWTCAADLSHSEAFGFWPVSSPAPRAKAATPGVINDGSTAGSSCPCVCSRSYNPVISNGETQELCIRQRAAPKFRHAAVDQGQFRTASKVVQVHVSGAAYSPVSKAFADPGQGAFPVPAANATTRSPQFQYRRLSASPTTVTRTVPAPARTTVSARAVVCGSISHPSTKKTRET